MSVPSGSRTFLRLPALLLVAGVLGFAAGFTVQDRASAGLTPFPSDLFGYTYGNDQCETGDEKDPINVVFTNFGFAPEIRIQADNHGDWIWDDGETQWFGDQYDCFIMDNQNASNPGGDLGGRFHVRYYNHENATGGVRTIPVHGSIASADAHHEDTVLCGFNPFAHAIDDDSESFTIAGFTGGGGFNRGREDIRKNWVVNADHVREDSHYWDNTMVMDQCNGNMASSDGWVYYIRTFDATADTDEDGCTTEQELQLAPGSQYSGGLRDPTYFWDYYDTWTTTAGGWEKNRAINIIDIIGTANRFGPGGGGFRRTKTRSARKH